MPDEKGEPSDTVGGLADLEAAVLACLVDDCWIPEHQIAANMMALGLYRDNWTQAISALHDARLISCSPDGNNLELRWVRTAAGTTELGLFLASGGLESDRLRRKCNAQERITEKWRKIVLDQNDQLQDLRLSLQYLASAARKAEAALDAFRRKAVAAGLQFDEREE